MFTGIVQSVGTAVLSEDNILTVEAADDFWNDVKIGDSIAVNGCCLTVVSMQATESNSSTAKSKATFFVSEETKRLTQFDKTVNLEKSLRYGDSVGGHVMTGHVDGLAEVISVENNLDGSCSIWICVASRVHYLERKGEKIALRLKGSIAINGVSLTIAEINLYQVKVMVIPYTLKYTNLHFLRPGSWVNIEFDRAVASKATPSKSTDDVVEPKEQDKKMMRKAIALGEHGRCTSAPNPWVGCVIANFNYYYERPTIGIGFHARCGEGHAEVRAVEDAKAKGNGHLLKGATLYCTLEPCAHVGRTGKCVSLIKSVGIRRVVVALEDPDEKVKGKGIQFLRENGIEVEVGVLGADAAYSLRPYLHHRRTGRPWVIWKVASSLDGHVVAADGQSKYITSAETRKDSHEHYRATSGAIVTGRGTMITDNPELSVRHWPKDSVKEHRRQPIRVVVTKSPNDTLHQNSKILKSDPLGNKVRVWVATVNSAAVPKWMEQSLEVIRLCNAPDSPYPNFLHLLSELGKQGVMQVLLECGPQMGTGLLAANLIDQLVVYQSPILLGNKAQPWIATTPYSSLAAALNNHWKLDDVRRIGEDVCLEYVKKPELAKGNDTSQFNIL